MYIRRLFIRNFRNFKAADITLSRSISCITGENNSGKSNLLHAIRLAIDPKLGSGARALTRTDFHCDDDFQSPTQIVIAAELADVSGPVQLAFAGIPALSDLGPTIAFRFRPGQGVRDRFDESTGAYVGPSLNVDDYEPELALCSRDPRIVPWFEKLGESMRIAQLQEFTVEFLPALRDVEQDLSLARSSPLEKLLKLAAIPSGDVKAIEDAFVEANKALRGVKTIEEISTGIQSEFDRIAGDVTGLRTGVGVADPTFARLVRTLTVLFDSDILGKLDTSRNGLGVNNLLYISMISSYFDKRFQTKKTPGQLLLVDEPEAHLHPQAQRVLFAALKGSGYQTVVATHSTHIASQAGLSSHVSLSVSARETKASNAAALLDANVVTDLERYLDATKSSLLFARNVLLVEGPAEQFMVPPLVKAALGIDLDRHFISVIPIYGKHFSSYAALFAESGLGKKCAILTDGDAFDSTADGEDEGPPTPIVQERDNVRVFSNATTFERTLAMPSMLEPLVRALTELGYVRAAKPFEEALRDGRQDERFGERGLLADRLLSVATRVGKARFAQVLSKHLDVVAVIPDYISDAVRWLVAPDRESSAP